MPVMVTHVHGMATAILGRSWPMPRSHVDHPINRPPSRLVHTNSVVAALRGERFVIGQHEAGTSSHWEPVLTGEPGT